MGTIIAHGKSQWGRSNKNRRVDPELEAEQATIEIPNSVVTQEAVILKQISDQVDVGTTLIKKIDEIPNLVVSVDTPQIVRKDTPVPGIDNKKNQKKEKHQQHRKHLTNTGDNCANHA